MPYPRWTNSTGRRTLLALRLHEGEVDEPARIRAAREGDPEARAWLAHRWEAPVYRFCRRMASSDEDARDAAQDTLIKVLKKLHQYDPNRKFSTWVFGIARNTCIDQYRRKKRRAWEEPGDVVDTAPSPDQQVFRQEKAEILEVALSRMKPMYREVLVLYHFEHLKYAEIAETLDIPIGTVMNRIFRARRKLRALYEDEGGDL